MSGNIAVAGCGRMGLGMLRALKAAGFAAQGFDIRPIDEPDMLPDVAALKNHAEILFTVVRDAPETDALLFDDQAVLRDNEKLQTLVICSTLSPRYLETIAERAPAHITLIDAPMSGAEIAATERRLSFMLGGNGDALDDLHPLLSAMGTRFHRMGGFGAGMSAKVLNNLVAASSVAATRTALSWADELGLEPDRLLALMHDSSGQTWFGSQFERIEFARDGYTDDNTIGILAKDVTAALHAVNREDHLLGKALIDVISALEPRER
ncbi:MAG: NAD(P)-dependent oxidoreductase [Pikeienuella sp.]